MVGEVVGEVGCVGVAFLCAVASVAHSNAFLAIHLGTDQRIEDVNSVRLSSEASAISGLSRDLSGGNASSAFNMILARPASKQPNGTSGQKVGVAAVFEHGDDRKHRPELSRCAELLSSTRHKDNHVEDQAIGVVREVLYLSCSSKYTRVRQGCFFRRTHITRTCRTRHTNRTSKRPVDKKVLQILRHVLRN